ncbi:hypothetical protein QWM81_01945 [Streptomyces ficellus]|uniref:Uncharacterized protein n=1 Tax=Streptomyces ficellus TaxID=1977088 RepID=A0ABT7Z030_9ACTN|nr:hypothetical protein [Streptomyces ficellus]MDN3292825.1 hypothetical protein [Streptomyces ficellus]
MKIRNHDPLVHHLRAAARRVDLLALAAGALFALTLAVAVHQQRRLDFTHPGPALGAVITTGLALLLLAGLAGIRRLRAHRLWLASAWTATVLLTGTVLIWYAAVTDTSHTLARGTLVTSMRDTDAYLARHAPSQTHHVRVPTGVFIQALRFTGPYDVEVSGYIWQRYADSVPAGIQRGIVLPEADDSYQPRKVYDIHRDGEHVIGWYFNVKIRQVFDYRTYPLDEQDVWLRLWHPDFESRVQLVPDLAAYPPWRGPAAYGLDPDFVPGNWAVKTTSFSYDTPRYSANFGQGRQYREEAHPELYFNMHMAREFASPLFGRIIPLAFIAVLAFASLFVTTKNTRRYPLAGFDGLTVVELAAAVLLVLNVDHNSAREATGSHGITYIDYVYFCLYFMIIGVVWNSLLLSRGPHLSLIQWRDNLAPKLLYWPVLAFLLCSVTALTFLL